MREKGDKPKPEPKRAKGVWLRVPSPSEFAATHKYSGFAAPAPEPFCAGCWHNCRPASTTNSRLTSTGRAGNTDQPANGQARVESKSSVASIRTFSDRREHGIQGRLSAVGVLAAGRRLKVRSADVLPSRSHLDLR